MNNTTINLPVLNFFRKGNRVHVAKHDFGFAGEEITITIRKIEDRAYDVRIVRDATDHEYYGALHAFASLAGVRGVCREQVAKIGEELVAGTPYEVAS